MENNTANGGFGTKLKNSRTNGCFSQEKLTASRSLGTQMALRRPKRIAWLDCWMVNAPTGVQMGKSGVKACIPTDTSPTEMERVVRSICLSKWAKSFNWIALVMG